MDGVRIVAKSVYGLEAADLRVVAAAVIAHLPKINPAAAILGASLDGKATLVAVVNDAFRESTNAGAIRLMRASAQRLGGGAGGIETLANAGGRNADQLENAIKDARAAADTATKR